MFPTAALSVPSGLGMPEGRGQRSEGRGQWKGAPSGKWGLGEEGLKALFISSLEKHTGF